MLDPFLQEGKILVNLAQMIGLNVKEAGPFDDFVEVRCYTAILASKKVTLIDKGHIQNSLMLVATCGNESSATSVSR